MLKTNAENFYPNKTSKYLLPALQDWGVELKSIFESIISIVLGVGISDGKHYEYVNNSLFILLKPKDRFQEILERFRNIEAYKHDYKVSDNHMVVLKMPEEHKYAISKFILGKYSYMYDTDSIERLFPKIINKKGMQVINDTHQILTKDSAYFNVFKEKLKTLYNVTKTPDTVIEMDVPPTMEEEIFDFNNSFITRSTKPTVC